MNIWNLFEYFETYKKIINDDEQEGERNTHVFVNVSTRSKVSSIAGTMACMIWKGTTYYAHIEYTDKTDPEDGLPDEDANGIDEIPVYSINKPKDETLAVLKILNNVKGPQKMVKKNRLLEKLEEVGLVDKNLSGTAKHSRLKGLLNQISVAGGLDNPLVEVEYKGRRSNVILTTQGENIRKLKTGLTNNSPSLLYSYFKMKNLR